MWRHRSQRGILAIAIAAVAVGGCYPYVNIPLQPNSLASQSANSKIVREVCVSAVQESVSEQPVDGLFRLVLPKGATYRTYRSAQEQIGDRVSLDSDPAIPVVEAREVRIRADLAQVDIIRAAAADEPMGQMTTFYMRWDAFQGWFKQRHRVWRTPVELRKPPMINPPEQGQPKDSQVAESDNAAIPEEQTAEGANPEKGP